MMTTESEMSASLLFYCVWFNVALLIGIWPWALVLIKMKEGKCMNEKEMLRLRIQTELKSQISTIPSLLYVIMMRINLILL